MLNFIYWPISALLWFWREVLSFVMDENSGFTWILAIILMTCTLKALLVKPTINQMRSSRKMQEIQPKIQAVRDRYKNDRTKAAEEMQRIYKEENFRPMAGCLPLIAQMPMFIGLFHVIRSFDRTGERTGNMSVEANRETANYIFKPEDVQSFLDARVGGVPLSATLRGNSRLLENVDTTQVAMIIIPLVVVIAVLTHVNARMMQSRQQARKAAGKVSQPTGENAQMMQQQMEMMNKMMLWFMPIMVISGAFIWSIGLLFYMFANTVWTTVQSRVVYAIMDREEEAEEQAKIEAKRTTAPKPGARKADKRSKKQRKQG